MMYLMVLPEGEIKGVTHERKSPDQIEVARDHFKDYPQECWCIVDGAVVLKEDADAIRDARAAELAAREAATTATDPARLSPVEFKMAFTISERMAIADARADITAEGRQTKQILDLWYEVIDDPRLTYVDLGLPSVIEGLDFLETLGILTAERKAAILATQSAA